METYHGKSVFGGIAIGKIQLYKKNEQQVVRRKVQDRKAECARLESAKETVREQLNELYRKAKTEMGESNASIFEVHQMLLDDLDYNETIRNMITTQHVNAEFAVAVTGDHFSKMFMDMEDEYMRARSADVKDISERLIGQLQGEQKKEERISEETIILAEDLAPSETVQIDKKMVRAFVTVHGSANSHTAILARSMNIPALIKIPIELSKELDGKEAIVDGFTGTFYVEPTKEIKQKMQKRQQEEKQKRELLKRLKGTETVTKDGKQIQLYANIGGVGDVADVLANDAQGIGLFRSEFLYLEKKDYPTEEEQFQAYRTVVEMMAGKTVIIRTCDIGADKQIEYFHLEKEENPALGYRAIRICLDRKEMFKTQLKAIFRASAYGKVALMYPMIISVEEVKQIHTLVDEVKKELDQNGILYGDVQQGIMIETPAAAMISDLLAKEVDFFSIGTNDLMQYTLAVDRQNAYLEDKYNPYHPAVLRMIEMVVKNAHEQGIWAGICGEMGADLNLTEILIKMGIDELSVTPSMILPVREKILQITYKK